jgi:acylphosphatase
MEPQRMTSSKTQVELIARRVLVSGKVQGVNYRATLAERARELNVQGWCRNLRDKRVEAWLCGTPDAVADLLAWMHKGPPGAAVDKMEIENQAVLEPMLGESIQAFEIRK